MAPTLAPKVKLNNGYEMPVLGLGTYEVSCLSKSIQMYAYTLVIKCMYAHILYIQRCNVFMSYLDKILVMYQIEIYLNLPK